MDSQQNKNILTQEVAIYTDGLTRRYGDVDALVDLDLQVPYGSIFGYLGRNGAGKTTTIRLLTGLAIPTHGRAWVAGYETTNRSHQSRRAFGYLPQEPAFYGWMTGQEFLQYVSRLLNIPSPERNAQVERVLDLTGLQKAARRRISGYSGGMKQRLAIAQALIGNPPVLFLDEPTSSLDPAGRQELLDMISNLKGKTTVFFSSHILGDIERVCDTIAVIHAGRLILVSGKDQLLENYPVNAAYLEIEVSSLPIPLNFLENLEKQAWVSRVILEQNTLQILASDVPMGKERLLPLVVNHGIQLNHYEWIRPSLEEIFLELSS